ncbi:MAG TPA: Nif3-like dinuclear metal center hexameric protein [Phycisphaerae bacterium]|nr:Nif3-like dinuclear metal center hexameric protein [Phycisphaerae bacterium]
MAKRVSRQAASTLRRRKGRGESGRTVADLCSAMEEIAPTWTAAEWDNVGLLAGSPDWPLRRVLLAIDLMPEVLEEAIAERFDAIVAYHPPIFKATKRLRVGRTSPEEVASTALANRIAIYSPHTALDATTGGTNDTIAEMAGIENPMPFDAARDPTPRCKLVVFVPAESVESVAAAVFEAGGGRIGDYSQCSFRIAGEGTFFGADAANPVVGQRGRLERVSEIRLEIVFPQRRLKEVVFAIRRSHPYEEPAFDVYPLAATPVGAMGQGRMGLFVRPLPAGALAKGLARGVGAAAVELIGPASQVVRRGFVCVGAAGSLPFEISGVALAPGDVVMTGEIRHHDALRYLGAGATAIALGHWASERPVLQPLSARLRRMLKGVVIGVSRRDRNPFMFQSAK